MDLLTTISGSLMEGFLPAGWDLKKIDSCVDPDPKTLTKPYSYTRYFERVQAEIREDFCQEDE